MENTVEYIAEHGCEHIKPKDCVMRNVKGDPCRRCRDLGMEHLFWPVKEISRERARQEIYHLRI